MHRKKVSESIWMFQEGFYFQYLQVTKLVNNWSNSKIMCWLRTQDFCFVQTLAKANQQSWRQVATADWICCCLQVPQFCAAQTKHWYTIIYGSRMFLLMLQKLSKDICNFQLSLASISVLDKEIKSWLGKQVKMFFYVMIQVIRGVFEYYRNIIRTAANVVWSCPVFSKRLWAIYLPLKWTLTSVQT